MELVVPPRSPVIKLGVSSGMVPGRVCARRHSGSCRSAFAINSFGPQPIDALKPEDIYELWMGLIAPDRHGPAITCPRRRSLAAMARKVMAEAQTRYDETGSLPQPLI